MMRLQRPPRDEVIRVKVPPQTDSIKVKVQNPFLRRTVRGGVLVAGLALSMGVGWVAGRHAQKAQVSELIGEFRRESLSITHRRQMRELINMAMKINRKQGGTFEDCLWKAAKKLDYSEEAIRLYLDSGVLDYFSNKSPFRPDDEIILRR